VFEGLRDVAERLAAQDDALSPGGPAAGRAAGSVGRFTEGTDVTRDTAGIGDQRQELHPAAAARALKDIEVEGSF
jgi:hypothetical protein